MNEAGSLVRQSSLGTELSEKEAAALGALMTARSLADGEFLVSEGTFDDSLHVLIEGKLEAVKDAGPGEPASLAILRDGDLAGELSCIDGEKHTVGLRALCDCRLLSLKQQELESVRDDNARLAYKVMRAVARSAHRIVHRMNYESIELRNYILKQHGRY